MNGRLHPARRGLRYEKRHRRSFLLGGVCLLVCLALGLFVLPHTSSSDVTQPTVSMAPAPPSSLAPRWTEQATSGAPSSTLAFTDAPPDTLTSINTAAPLPRPAVDEGSNAAHATVEAPTGNTHTISDAPPPTERPQRDSVELHSRYAAELVQLDALDVFPLRPYERRISFVEFARCLATRLSVSPDTGVEVERHDLASDRYAPFLISVTLENTQDLKALICNLTMPYRYIVLAQNGDTPEVTPFFRLLRRVFAFTTRLTVLQFPDNIGFAGAVNAGLREALSHPFSEVPFLHIVHNDVRFLFSSLEQAVARAYKTTARDTDMIDALEKEVATEPNEYTPLIRQPDGLRTPLLPGTPLPQQHDRKPVVVTSALLPDRVRYMTPSRRAELMVGHTSFMFANSRGEYTSVFLTRLAVLTVGFFDENFFPILYDDTDYRWRAHLLGFVEDHNAAMNDQVISFDLDCVNQAMSDVDGDGNAEGPLGGLRKAATGPTLSPKGKALQRDCRKAFYAGVQYAYMQQKWGVESMTELMQAHTRREPFSGEAFAGRLRLPLDAWVVDRNRLTNLRTWLRDVGRRILDVDNYNTDVILQAVSP
ncbi:hypothetical protein CGC21_31655 [Leishmania donovani]|uniref:Galactofuranosyltransferase lpg1-like protein n=2 Tax=Leishmania donovani TaxID=5661 RepID=A0A504X4T7_LEIDO|nr:hypothetical protein CGC21_31655 [Leishmania donovani]